MFKKLISVILSLIMVTSLLLQASPAVLAVSTVWDGSAAAGFALGSGAEDDPYIIETAEQLAFFANSVNSGTSYSDKYIKLASDIILNDTTNWENWGSYNEQGYITAPVNEWTPIGGIGHYFRGTFDGDGHKVSGVYINKTENYQGLFGYVYNGTVKNLGVEESYIKGRSYVGGVVGYDTCNSTITGCSNTGKVFGEYYVGGIVGENYEGTAEECHNKGSVSGKNYAGGIVGSNNYYATVQGCSNAGYVYGTEYVGGVVGKNDDGTINDCYNTNTISGGNSAGGIVGYSDNGIIAYCRNTGSVSGTGYGVGGIAGYCIKGNVTICHNSGEVFCSNYYAGGIVGQNQNCPVRNCFNTGSVGATGNVGGIIGTNDNTNSVADCYNVGTVSGNYYIGALIGYQGNSTINGCYYLADCASDAIGTFMCGIGSSSYGGTIPDIAGSSTKLTNEQLKNEKSFVNWNFDSIWEIGYDKNYSYPTLRCFGSKIFNYRITFTDKNHVISSDTFPDGTVIICEAPFVQDGYDFEYYERDDGNRYYPGDEIVIDKEAVYTAAWSIKNTSENVWDGTLDTEWQGSGTENDPYLIGSAEELAGFAKVVYDNYYCKTAYYKLTSDITLNDYGEQFDYYTIGKNIWTPVNNFVGTFDGDGYTVSGLYINTASDQAGMFGKIDSGATVKSLTVEKSYIKGENNVGGIVGLSYGTVTDSSFSGTVTGNSCVGGIIGDGTMRSSVTRCYNNGNIHGISWTGGIIGCHSDHGMIDSCNNLGEISGDNGTGGIAGHISEQTTLNECHNSGKIVGNNYVGGIAGYSNNSSAERCINTGAVIGESNAGGIIGNNMGGSVTDCYNTGDIAGGSTVGGITGYNSGSTVSTCYNVGNVGGADSVGGVVGKSGTVKNCYYINTCTTNSNSYGTVLTDAQMKKEESFESWNFYRTWEIGFDSEYPYPTLRCFGSKIYDYRITFKDGDTVLSNRVISEGTVITCRAPYTRKGFDFAYFEREDLKRYYPGDEIIIEKDAVYTAAWSTKNTSVNVWNGTADTDWQGNGSEAEPYLITTAEELAGLAENVNGGTDYSGKYFKLTSDILLNDGGELFDNYVVGKNFWTSIGDSRNYFSGTFDGDGYKVGGVYINNTEDYRGLFGCVYGGTVKNLGVEGSYIKGSYYVGGVVGYNDHYSTVSDCYNTGRVSGTGTDYSIVGGVVGENYGTVTECYNTGEVRGTFYVGGVIGDNMGYSVADCYNTGDISGTGNYVGGVIGCSMNCTVTDCYNTGSVSGTYDVGGVAGSGSVTSCNNTGSVSGTYDVGGVVGSGSATNCSNAGSVSGTGNYVGGVVGDNWGVTVTDCYNTGEVSGTYDIGGVVGVGSVTNCYNIGEVSGATHVGGVTGEGSVRNSNNTGSVSGTGNYVGGMTGEGYTTNCYNTGNVSGTTYVGGLTAEGSATNCYNTGSVSGTTYVGGVTGEGAVTNCYNTGSVSGTGNYFGGVIGDDCGSVTNCYYIDTCVKNPSITYGTPLTEAKMKLKESYVGFDFDEYWEIGVKDGYDYPTLQNVEHIITYKVTFLDRDGTVLKTQTGKGGFVATPPAVEAYTDGEYVYAFDHWDGSYTYVTKDTTVIAVYKQVEIIRFNDITVPFTVEYGFSREELRVELEAYFTRKLCTTTNGYKMMCEVVWNEDDLNAYNAAMPGDYTVNGVLKITDPAYSTFADYYAMADGAAVRVTVKVLQDDENIVIFTPDDLSYTVSEDGSSVTVTGYGGSASEIMIPDTIDGYTVCAIGDNAFKDNTVLTAITIPSSVRSVGSNAFFGCTSLVQAAFEEGVEAIGDSAFYNTGLVSVTLPDSVDTIGGKAFGYYGEDSLIEGFAIYCSTGSAAALYAEENGINCNSVGEQMDEETGITVVAEENVTLVVAQVEEGTYYESAQQIVRENDNISLFEIKIVDKSSNEVQPGNTMTVSVPVPDGFDADRCEVYRINSDGTYKAMNAKLIDGKLVFLTPHLSYYAIIESECAHTETEIRDYKAATCAKDGYTGNTYCSKCGEKLADGEVIPATGEHTFGTTAADYYYAGSGHHSTACTVCGYVLTEECTCTVWVHNSNNTHRKSCTVCTTETYNVCTPDADGYCTVCGGKYDTSLPSFGVGDINDDDLLSPIDSSMMISIILGAVIPDQRMSLAADINGNGEIDSIDSSMMVMLMLGKLVTD